MNLSYSEAKRDMISGLLYAASEHEVGRLSEIELSFDTLDERLPRDAGPEFDQLFIALNFWEGWIDARNHDWKYYEGIRTEDWPRLARSIAEDLKADRDITDEVVRKHFDFKSQVDEPSIFKRLVGNLLRKE
jgi:hypothetical protein